jgi:hypothetical protein
MTTPGIRNEAAEWAPCHCCGRTYPVSSMATFSHHPGDHVCAGCAHWLYAQIRPAIRNLGPHLTRWPRIQAWVTRQSLPSTCKPGA